MKMRSTPILLAALLAGVSLLSLADVLPRLGCIYYGTLRNCYGGRCTSDDGVRLTVNRNGAPLTWCDAGTGAAAFDYRLQLNTVAPGQTADAGTATEGETLTLSATVEGLTQGIIGSSALIDAGRGINVRRDLILGTDEDQDGLPDEWEAFILQGFQAMGVYDVTTLDPTDVYNGATVRDHFLGCTFPFLPGDSLRFTAFRLNDGTVEVEFLANATLWYGLSSGTNLTDQAWTITRMGTTRETAGRLEAVPGQGAYLKVYVPTNSLPMFYRLFVQ